MLTKCGDIDAKEILGAIDQVVEKGLCDPKKIILIGGIAFILFFNIYIYEYIQVAMVDI